MIPIQFTPQREPGGSPRFWRLFLVLAVAVMLAGAADAHAQAGFPVYTDHLVNGFQDWGWAPHNYADTNQSHTGACSVSVTISDSTYQGLQMVRSPFDSSPYASVSLWINGGTSGGQRLQVSGLAQVGTKQNTWQSSSMLAALLTNTWQQITIPLSALGIADKTNCTGIVVQDRIGAIQPTFYLDDIRFNAKPAPVLVQISVNTTQAVRSVDARWFGVNTAIWDENFDQTVTVNALKEMDVKVLRFPGGSISDEYHWAINKSLSNTLQWVTSFSNFVHVATNIGARAFITVNYGTGTPAEAAAWVRHANVTNLLAYEFWEIGNECFGTWERDTNVFPHDPYTYAVRATNYIARMKAADPTIKVGIVVAAGENSFSNAYTPSHPAVNPRTGQTHYGWTPILLTTLKNLGVTPDFAVHHFYPEYTSGESDPLLLQASVNWAHDAADLRQQITDYFGSAGTNIELVCTENNSNSGLQGKQSTSLVNGLYYADSLGQLMKTEINAFVWWDLRNSQDFSGNMDDTLYGWKNYGDLGMITGANTRHPTFYAAKLMQYLARPGDAVLEAASDCALLTAYAARRAGGAVTLLVLNKDTVTNLNARISLDGFIPTPAATLRSYGIPQDEAARTNGPAAAQDIATTHFAGAAATFDCSFAPLSLTLFTLAPAPPALAPLRFTTGGPFVFQLQGQPLVRYVIQTSTNLTQWDSVSTNTLAAGTLDFTNAISPGPDRRFWRAVWQP